MIKISNKIGSGIKGWRRLKYTVPSDCVCAFAKYLSFKHVWFEGDAEGVVRSLRDGVSSNAFVGHSVEDFRSIVGLFRTYSISNVRRQGNRMSFPFLIWVEDYPPNVLSVVTKDVSRWIYFPHQDGFLTKKKKKTREHVFTLIPFTIILKSLLFF